MGPLGLHRIAEDRPTWSPFAWPSHAAERETEAEHADEPTTIDIKLIHTLDTTALKLLFAELSIVKNGHLNSQELFFFALVSGHLGGPDRWGRGVSQDC